MGEAPYRKLALFEVAVLYHPAQALEGEAERVTSLAVPITPVLARDEKHAAMIGARKIADSLAPELDRCEVVVRPF